MRDLKGKGQLMERLERAAGIIPSPFTLLCVLFLFTAAASCLLSYTGYSAVHPATGELVSVKNFFSRSDVVWFLKSMVTNFSGYAPLGLVLIMTAGVGMLEQTGMVYTLLKTAMSHVPSSLAPFGCALIGICGNIFSDSCTVIIPPLAALVFLGVGRNPVAGMLCAFLGCSAGFSANLFLTGTDGLLAGITNTVLNDFFGENVCQVHMAGNWFFMIVSTVVLSALIAWLTSHTIEPVVTMRMQEETGRDMQSGSTGHAEADRQATESERRALKKAAVAAAVYIGIVAAGYCSGILSAEGGGILGSPLLSGIIPLLFGLFFAVGLTYGRAVGKIKKEGDVSAMLASQLRTMAPFLVFVLASSQFINLFNWTDIGTVISIQGSYALEKSGFTDIPLLVLFILLASIVNLFIGPGAAKWTIMAPVFVPILTLLGYHPALVQLAYRIGDSCTNAMSPTSAYIFMILGIA
ncbi:MAG: AbgT family transporter [Lachnospiraceae bacterium]|nr:AbgT family transporter [Lachnospiraceae bacterium]